MILLQILLGFIFYCLIGTFYFYSKGKFKVKDQKTEQYIRWVDKYGNKASIVCLNLFVIYTILLLLQIFS